MMINGYYEKYGRKIYFSANAGNWLDSRIRITFCKEDLEKLSDEELIIILREFQEFSDDMQTHA